MTPTLESPDNPAIICPCDRDWQELRCRQEVARGRVRLVFQYQCRRCGRGHGIWSRAPVARALPAWDSTLPLAHDVELEVPEQAAWWRLYDEYLQSPEWEQKRARVFARERDLQGRDDPLCASAPAAGSASPNRRIR